jgi:hypothetical protein
MSRALEQILQVVLEEMENEDAAVIISQSELPLHMLVDRMAVTASMEDMKKSLVAIIEYIPATDILNEVSQDMGLDEYLGDWDQSELVEYVVENYPSKVVDELLDNMEVLIKYMGEEHKTELASYIAPQQPKPVIRLHTDGSATIKELKIQKEHIIRD